MPKTIVYIDESGLDLQGDVLLEHEVAITKAEAIGILYALKNHWLERTEPHYTTMSALIKRLNEIAYD